jgi:nitroimidazol reductase NimA-like FMN-containing flavoprotein (pyridoxamine 5'-phosphate oxidase superfamily)
MTEPVAELDPRFSAPDAAPTSWADARRALETAELSWISTVRPDRRPHVSPLPAVWLDDQLYFTTGAGEQKAQNLSANPHVVITTGCNTWDRGLDVMVEGEAARVTDPALLERLATAWTQKWDGRWRYRVADGAFHHEVGTALVFSVVPTKVLAFGKGTFTQTRYRP